MGVLTILSLTFGVVKVVHNGKIESGVEVIKIDTQKNAQEIAYHAQELKELRTQAELSKTSHTRTELALENMQLRIDKLVEAVQTLALNVATLTEKLNNKGVA